MQGDRPSQILACFLAVFDASAALQSLQAAAKAEGDDTMEIDELAVDERQAYRAKLTKWVYGSVTAMQNPAFWFVLRISHEARAPLTFFFACLAKDGPDGLSKTVGPARDLPIVKLLCVRLQQVRARFDDMFKGFDSWVDSALTHASNITARVPQSAMSTEEVSVLRTLAWEILLHHSSSFTRRIEQYLNQLLGLIHD